MPEYARDLNVSERTVKNWIQNGKVNAKKLGGQWFIYEGHGEDDHVGCQIAKLKGQEVPADGKAVDLATVLHALAGDFALGVSNFTLADICARRLGLDWESAKKYILKPLALADIVQPQDVPGKGFSSRSMHELRHDRYWLTALGKRIVDRLSSASDLGTLPGDRAQQGGTEVGRGSPSADKVADRIRVDDARVRAGLVELIDEGVAAAKGLLAATSKDEEVEIKRAEDWETKTFSYVAENLGVNRAANLEDPADIPNSVRIGVTYVIARCFCRWRRVQRILVLLRQFRNELELGALTTG